MVGSALTVGALLTVATTSLPSPPAWSIRATSPPMATEAVAASRAVFGLVTASVPSLAISVKPSFGEASKAFTSVRLTVAPPPMSTPPLTTTWS